MIDHTLSPAQMARLNRMIELEDNDFWSADDFEERLNSSILTLNTTKVQRRAKRTDPFYRFTEKELRMVRQRGLFIPAPGRLVIDADEPLDITLMPKLPTEGAVSYGEPIFNAAGGSHTTLNHCSYFRRLTTAHKGV